MKLNLIDCMPAGKDGKKSLLPKQLEFFNNCTSISSKAKYIAYVGGIGSGKTVIGCLTMLAMAVQKSGTYLVCRQYMPELKMTTYKQFLDMCPPELIVEHRIADSLIRLRSTDGVSTIYFRGLDEFDKLRSLNLNAFWIDEANQVSEEAFLLLQGRLRGAAWRKGIITSNPSGHDFLYKWFKDKSHIVKDEIKELFHLVRAPTTENIHLPDGYVDSMLNTWSKERILREIEGSMDAFEGKVYEEFNEFVHCIHPFAIPKEWDRFIGIDHGYRNPAAWVYGAVGPDGEIYIYKEYYQTEKLIKEIVYENMALMKEMNLDYKKLKLAVIDPAVKQTRGATGESDWDEYLRHLPKDFPITFANNDVTLGIDRVKQYMKVDDKSKKPLFYVFNSCKNVLDEISQYRYPELKPNQDGKKAEHEKPIKAKDHSLDAIRYMVMLLPEPYKKKKEEYLDKIKYNSIERSIFEEIQKLKRPKKNSDPWPKIGGI